MSAPDQTPGLPNPPNATTPPNPAWSAKSTRRVPVQTPMWEGTPANDSSPGFDTKLLGRLSRTWIKFWEQKDTGSGSGSGGGGPYQRTLLIRNTAVADDIADHVTCYGPVPGVDHTVILVTGVLRKAITADLTVRINNVAAGVNSVVGTFTIPMATAVDAPVSFSSFDTATLPDLSTFTWDITASDGSKDSAGVASFTIEWQP